MLAGPAGRIGHERSSKRKHPAQAGAHEQGPAPRGARPRADQRLLLGRLHRAAGAQELGLPADANPYYHYDLDWIVTVPNMDPWIRPFETLKETPDEVVVKTGFGAVMRKVFDCPMPEFIGWETDTLEKLEAAEFDDPRDRAAVLRGRRQPDRRRGRRLRAQLAALDRHGQVAVARLPGLRQHDRVLSECLTRLIGQQNTMLWMGVEPERMGAVHRPRRRSSTLECAKAADRRRRGPARRLRHLGRRGLQEEHVHVARLLARRTTSPGSQAIVEYAHATGLPVIYHGCGNVQAIFQDYIEIGHRRLQSAGSQGRAWTSSTCAAATATAWASAATATSRSGKRGDRDGHPPRGAAQAQRGQGGGFIFQSDHSVSSAVSGHTYDYIVKLVREYGRYPLQLGELRGKR